MSLMLLGQLTTIVVYNPSDYETSIEGPTLLVQLFWDARSAKLLDLLLTLAD
jgi:hypothetical protein